MRKKAKIGETAFVVTEERVPDLHGKLKHGRINYGSNVGLVAYLYVNTLPDM